MAIGDLIFLAYNTKNKKAVFTLYFFALFLFCPVLGKKNVGER
jgi:hypothetical protein